MLVATSEEHLDFNVETLKGGKHRDSASLQVQMEGDHEASTGDGTLSVEVIRAAILTPFIQVAQQVSPVPIVQVKGYRIRNGEKAETSYCFTTESMEQHRVLYEVLRKHQQENFGQGDGGRSPRSKESWEARTEPL